MIIKIRTILSLLFVLSAAFSSCSKYDDSELRDKADDLTNRITTIEEWSKKVNTEITSLQGLIKALESNYVVTSVVESPDKSGYTISFSKGAAITIKHGINGNSGNTGNIGNSGTDGTDGIDATAPILGTKKFDDGFYYWTIQKGTLSADWLLDVDGNKIRTTGNDGKLGEAGKDAIAPQVRINPATEMWEVSTNGGTTWASTGVKANGDSIFTDVDTSDPYNVKLTLADGTEITLPRSSTLTIGFESTKPIEITKRETIIKVQLPQTLKEGDYTMISAEIKNSLGSNIDIKTRAPIDSWKASITEPTFDDNGVYQDNVEVKLVAPNNGNNELDELTILTVSIADKKGTKFTASLGFTASVEYIVNVSAGKSLQQTLTAANIDPAKIKVLTITGTLADADFAYIKADITNLTALDLADTDITALPAEAIGSTSSINTKLKTFIFPKNLLSIGEKAFRNCTGFTGNLTIPSSVVSIGEAAFANCTGFTGNLTIHNVKSIGEAAFRNCTGFTGNLTIPSSVVSIGDLAFLDCEGFTGLTLNSVVSIGKSAFMRCSGFTGKLIIPSSVESIGSSAFAVCSGFTGELIIPSSVESIESSAFNGCYGFTGNLTIPSYVKSIGNGAFNGCSGFTGLTIPSSVKSIGDIAFLGCSGITQIKMISETPIDYKTDMFPTGKPILVPTANLDAYKTKWNRFINPDLIEGYD